MTYSYFNTPNANDDPADDQPQMNTNFSSISSLISVDHVGFNVTGGGQHEKVTFNANNVPSVPTSPPVLFTDTVNGISQLFFYSGDAAHSSSQYVYASNGSTLLLGGIILKWGTYATGGDNANISFVSAFPNNCYQVLITPISATAVTSTIFVTQGSITTSKFQTSKSGTSNFPIMYFAIGD